MQYQIPGGPMIDDDQTGLEFALPGIGYFNEGAASGSTSVPVIVHHLQQQGQA